MRRWDGEKLSSEREVAVRLEEVEGSAGGSRSLCELWRVELCCELIRKQLEETGKERGERKSSARVGLASVFRKVRGKGDRRLSARRARNPAGPRPWASAAKQSQRTRASERCHRS